MKELAEQNSTYVEGAASCQHFMRRFQLSSSHNMSTSVHLLNVHVAKTVVSLLRVVDAHITKTKVERLLRKMMLKLISATLPVTLNPSMQFLVLILNNLIKSLSQMEWHSSSFLRMACLSLVLTASVLLHATNAPYVKVAPCRLQLGIIISSTILTY